MHMYLAMNILQGCPGKKEKKKKEGPLCSSPMDILGCGQREVERMGSVH